MSVALLTCENHVSLKSQLFMSAERQPVFSFVMLNFPANPRGVEIVYLGEFYQLIKEQLILQFITNVQNHQMFTGC